MVKLFLVDHAEGLIIAFGIQSLLLCNPTDKIEIVILLMSYKLEIIDITDKFAIVILLITDKLEIIH